MADHTPSRAPWPLVIILAAGFALAHTQSPLFFSNQNQYLVHGLADAGYGHLSHDWLANTKDPTPAFTWLVTISYKLGGLFAIQVAFFVLLMAYFVAMWRLVESISLGGTGILACGGIPAQAGMPVPPRLHIMPFTALFTAAHAAIFRLGSVRLMGVDYPWYLQSGLAGQYALGPGLQPSAFGVLLLASMAAFARGRVHLAAAFAALSADAHATYFLPAALLTIGYAAALLREKRIRTALSVSALSLAVAMPMLVYVLISFPRTNPDEFAAARQTLAHVRIPHHSQITRWLDFIAVLQIVWIIVGLVLLRKTRLFVPLIVAAGGSASLTVLQAITGSDGLALLFPWRISSFLVPLTTALLAAKLASRDQNIRLVNPLAGLLFALQVAGGIAVMEFGLGYQMNEFEQPLLNHIRDHGGPNDVYLIPTSMPAASGKRGVTSNSFTPAPRPGSAGIPVDLQRFRLATGAAIFVDFKSVPYAGGEVMEWLRRMRQVERWYAEKDWDRIELREQFLKEGITHVVVPKQQWVFAEFLESVYQDDVYVVYRVK